MAYLWETVSNQLYKLNNTNQLSEPTSHSLWSISDKTVGIETERLGGGGENPQNKTKKNQKKQKNKTHHT